MSNIHFIQLADYQAPKITENKREQWVDFGEDNNYYQFLIDRYNGSTTNNAVINNITKLIYGKGLTATDANRKPNEYAQMKMLFSKDTIKKIAKDLKLLGEYNLQLIYNEQKSKIVRVEHLPTNLVRSEKCDKDGVINAIYYCDNWQDTKKFPPKRIPLFGYGSKSEKLEVLRVGNYTIGQKYYSNIDYIGGISYATLEEEISNYLINDVQRGFSGRSIINFNNGVPTEEQQTIISAKVKSKLTGSKGDPVIVSFNSDETKKTTVDKISVDNAAEHYSFLSKESLEKIMLSHNVTSPLLFGIATSTGFSANADELRNSFILFENMVIKPFQETICEGLDKVLAFNEIALDLKFNQLQPLDAEGELTKAVETPTQLSSQEIDLSKFGEEIDLNEWELVDSREVNYEEEARLDAELYALNNPKKSLLSKVFNFVSSGTAIPNAKSGQDGELFKSRYRYSGEIGSNSRKFCVKMLGANKVYRKEDIEKMSLQIVNETRQRKDGTIGGLGPNGDTKVNVWLYKGGGACHHFWTRETYRKKADVNSPLAEQITPAQARKSGEILPTNNPLVYQKPIDMPNKGFLPK